MHVTSGTYSKRNSTSKTVSVSRIILVDDVVVHLPVSRSWRCALQRTTPPYPVTRTAWWRPPFSWSSGAAEVVEPPETPAARRRGVVEKLVGHGFAKRMARRWSSGRRERRASVWGEGASTPPYTEGGGSHEFGVLPPLPTSCGWSLHSNHSISNQLSFKIPRVIFIK